MNADQILVGAYDYRAVTLSVLLALLGSYATIHLASRLAGARGKLRAIWLTGGATVMGVGTWSMHYTGMLAFELPVEMHYHWPTALLAFLPSLFSSGISLYIVRRRQTSSLQTAVGSIFMGAGIVALHYTAMASMRVPAITHYSPLVVALSAALAIGISWMSLWMMFRFGQETLSRGLRRGTSAILLAAAIVIMHYTGMASATFSYSVALPDLYHTVSVSFLDVAGITTICSMILLVAFLTSTMDRIQRQKALLDELFEQTPEAVALIDVDDRVIRVNREFTRMFGYLLSEASGRPLRELIVPDELRDEYQKYATLTAQGQRVDAESVRRRKDGSRLQVSIVRVPVSLPGGRAAVYSMFRDVTARMRDEEQLRATSEQLRALSASLRSAREEEGARIARALHDELGSALTSLKWDLETIDTEHLQARSESDDAKLRERIEAMNGLINSTISAIRRISAELRPSLLDDLGLVAAIEWHVQQCQSRTGIIFHCDCAVEDISLNQEQSTAIFRIFQEALTNILRHAQATRVDVRLAKEGNELVLTVRDNGRGITETEKSGLRSLGLLGMRERAYLIGGEISVTDDEEEGTVVTLRVPIYGKVSARKAHS